MAYGSIKKMDVVVESGRNPASKGCAFYFSDKSVRFIEKFLDLTRTKTLVFKRKLGNVSDKFSYIQTLVGDVENYSINKGGRSLIF